MLKHVLFSPEPDEPPTVGADYEAHFLTLPPNPAAVRPDIEREIEDSIPLIDPQPKRRLKLEE